MGEDEKKDYRLHLINIIDNLIDNGISVYDLDVVNKKAIRHNYINKQVVIDKINENSNIIKEIEEKIKEEENSRDICREYIRDLNRQKGLVKRDILTLQELLEGRNKNG